MINETAVLKAVGSFDQVALTAIFNEYAPAIYKYLLRIGVKAKEADQTVGDVFARMLEMLGKGEGPRTNLRSYLFQSAYHLVIDYAREGQRTAPLEVAIPLADEQEHVQRLTEEKILLEKLKIAMERALTKDQRNVLILRFQEDFSLKETAAIVSKNVNAVKAIQNRAINNLREAMSADLVG
jgi:RNA polymerase sigma-70 factor (ECF subfamily)